jgi:hypothetical protein
MLQRFNYAFGFDFPEDLIRCKDPLFCLQLVCLFLPKNGTQCPNLHLASSLFCNGKEPNDFG